jgi:hypothetical protein
MSLFPYGLPTRNPNCPRGRHFHPAPTGLLPYESTDPKQPGTVHAVRIGDCVFLSPAAYRGVTSMLMRQKARAWFRVGEPLAAVARLLERVGVRA